MTIPKVESNWPRNQLLVISPEDANPTCISTLLHIHAHILLTSEINSLLKVKDRADKKVKNRTLKSRPSSTPFLFVESKKPLPDRLGKSRKTISLRAKSPKGKISSSYNKAFVLQIWILTVMASIHIQQEKAAKVAINAINKMISRICKPAMIS